MFTFLAHFSGFLIKAQAETYVFLLSPLSIDRNIHIFGAVFVSPYHLCIFSPHDAKSVIGFIIPLTGDKRPRHTHIALSLSLRFSTAYHFLYRVVRSFTVEKPWISGLFHILFTTLPLIPL